MGLNRRRVLSGIAGSVTAGTLAGCIGGNSESGSSSETTTAAASFFIFGDITTHVTGETAKGELLVPVGQHGHGWEPGASVRRDIRQADLLVHGMDGFQPWVDDIKGDLEADDANVETIDISSGVDLLTAGEDGHSEEHDHSEEDEHGSGMDPHFWMDPLRVKKAVDNVGQGLVDIDSENEAMYAENAEEFKSELEDLHEQIDAIVAEASKSVVLVAGHNSFRYLGDRYGIQVEALTNISPDDRPSLEDRKRAQEIIEEHDLRYICADPIESQQAATQLVEDTDVEAVLPLTAVPGLTDEWESEEWGYVDIMKNVNLPTLERVLSV